MRQQGKVAVVTGASRGIGRAISIALAQKGVKIVNNYRLDDAGARQTSHLIEELGGESIIFQGDVTVPEDIERLLYHTVDTYHRVDILVNNAGITHSSDVFEITEEEWDRILAVNLKGAFFCAKTFGAHMLEAETGCIINIGSTAAFYPKARSHHYVASKAGIVGLTKALALSLAPNVRVNCIAPGFVKTEKWSARSANRFERAIAKIPLGRLANADEIAETVVFLALGATYITGQTIVVDGGLSLGSTSLQ